MSKVSAKNSIILINGYNFSTYATAFETLADVNKLDVTGFTDGTKNFIPGLPSATINAAMLWDSATAKIHAALVSRPTGYVTIIPEGYALGNNTISLPFMQGNYQPKGAPDAVVDVGTLNFMSYGNNVGLEYGVALQYGNITNTTSTTGVLDPTNAAVTAACSATLHIYTACATTDTYAIVVEHSTTLGSGYATLATFTLDGSAIGAERILVASGTINKYRRVTATRTGSAGDTLGFAVHFQHQ